MKELTEAAPVNKMQVQARAPKPQLVVGDGIYKLNQTYNVQSSCNRSIPSPPTFPSLDSMTKTENVRDNISVASNYGIEQYEKV